MASKKKDDQERELVDPDDVQTAEEALEATPKKPLVPSIRRARPPAFLTRMTRKRVEAETEFLGALKDHDEAALDWARSHNALSPQNLGKVKALDEEHLDEALEETSQRREVRAAEHQVKLAELERNLRDVTEPPKPKPHRKTEEEKLREAVRKEGGREDARTSILREKRIKICGGEDRDPETHEEKRAYGAVQGIMDRIYREGLS